MDNQTLKSAITKIEIIWSTTSKEKSDDPRAYEYIAVQSIALKRTVAELNREIGEKIHKNKEYRLKYQKLHNSLSRIIEILDFEQTPCKDENYIEDILEKLKKIGSQVNIIAEYNSDEVR